MRIMSAARIKKEKGTPAATPQTNEDKEIDEWARRLAAKPPIQIGVATAGGQQQSTLNGFLNLSSLVATNSDGNNIPPNNGFDLDSAIGRFTWHTMSEDKYIPCIFRNGEKFCCIRMVEISIIGELLQALPSELYDCANLNSHHATQAEAKILNHINSWHCDGFYGAELFTVNDLVVGVKDVELFYEFLSFAFHVLSTGGRNGDPNGDYSKCGFLKVNDNWIPFTVLDNGEKGVPLFYFEGQTDILKVKAIPLSGWELAYLKVCCKVQGVRKNLISGSSLQIVKLSDLKAYFPKRTVFGDAVWPPSKSKSLLPKSAVNGLVHMGSSQISSDRWTKNIPYKNSLSNPKPGSSVSVSTPNVFANNSNPTGVVMSKKIGGNNTVVANCNGVPQTQIPIGKDLHPKAESLKKIKVSGPPHDMSRLISITEYYDASGKEGAYAVRVIIIDKQPMHCINNRPFKYDVYLVVLQEFMNHFFPGVSIYPTAVSVLKSCGVSTFTPNSSMIKTLNTFGFSIKHPWEIPLIPAVEVTQAMTKLKNLFRPRTAAATVNDRTANSRSNGYPVVSNSTHHAR